MTRTVPVGEWRALGDRALLIGVDDPSAGRLLAATLRRQLADAGTTGAGVDVVAGAATVLVSVPDPAAELEPVRAALARAQTEGGVDDSGAPAAPGRLVTIPCVFDGPDLDEVARVTGTSPGAVVALLTAGPLSVAVMGFSPGFAYLEGLPDPLGAVPRRDRPRPLVAAGSVALANGHAAVYPTASPGGWQLVGRTGFPLFHPHEAPYAVLAPGDRVHFTVAGPGDDATPPPLARRAWDPPPDARPVLEVVAPGLRAVLQDGGRPGVAAVGVPWAGPADPVSLALANRLVGNADDAAAIEVTAGGLKLCGLSSCHVAIVGGAPEVRVGGHPVSGGRVTPVPDGDLLEVGAFRSGCRTYVAVAGGFLGPRFFGSVATDELSRLGPGALGPGQRLHAGPWAPPLGDHLAADDSRNAGGPPGVVELRVVAGPHAEVFAPDALARLAECAFVVHDSSNRVGIRLLADGGAPVPVPHTETGGRLDSHGVVTGVVQVPPGGQPVVLGPDHATLGGYPVLAVVAAADHGSLGQCAPGTPVRLVPVGLEAAQTAWRVQRRALDGAVVGHYPLAAG
jgi:KipI family sensor histidine kinase inhibitor